MTSIFCRISRQPFPCVHSFALVWLILLLGEAAYAQTNVSTNTDGRTPASLAPGAPAGSYLLSGLEQINHYSGNLSLTVPLLQIGGRGEAQTSLVAQIQKPRWRVEHSQVNHINPEGIITTQELYFAGQNWWNDTHTRAIMPGGRLTARHVGDQLSDCGSSGLLFTWSNTFITFTQPDGTELNFRSVHGNGTPLFHQCGNFGETYRGTVFQSDDESSAATVILDFPIGDRASPNSLSEARESYFDASGYLFLKNGTRYRFSSGRVEWIRDRNGNQITFSYTTGTDKWARRITDSLGRTVDIEYGINDVPPFGLCDRIKFKGFDGALRTIRISYSNLSGVLYNPTPPATPSLFSELDGVGTDLSPNDFIRAIWLPENVSVPRAYSFHYNSYGEVSRLILPTGGKTEYVHGGGVEGETVSGVCGEYTATRWNVFPAPQIGIYRRLLERHEFPDGANLSHKMTYAKLPSFNPDGDSDVSVSAVIPGTPSNTMLTYNIHIYKGDPVLNSFWGGTLASGFPDYLEGKEKVTESYKLNGQNPALNRKVENEWVDGAVGPKLASTKTTLLETNQVSLQTFEYDDYNNVKKTTEYDFETGAVGAKVRKTEVTYLTLQGSTNYDTVNGTDGQPYVANPNNLNHQPDLTKTLHLRGLPYRQEIRKIVGNAEVTVAATEFKYDETAPSTYAGVIAGYIAPTTAGRGNLTATRSWQDYHCSTPTTCQLDNWVDWTSGTWVQTQASYDQLGNVTQTVDAKQNITQFDYRDNFGAPNGNAQLNGEPNNTVPDELNVSPTLSTFAFPFKVTNALNHVAYTQFDYYLGKPVDTEDPNGIKSSLYYADDLDRPTKAIRAVGIASLENQTVITYNDGARTITTASDKDTNGDGVFQSQAKYDGLGRTWRAASLHGNGQWSIVDTEFDALGRAWRTSNPYFAANLNGGINPSGVWATATFDALSRVIQVTTPDSAIVTTAYSGNQVTVTDQALKKRKSETDALGQLMKVWEDPTGLNYLTSYSYDALDNLKTVTQDTQTRTFNYDSLKRLTSAFNPESGTVSYTYDPNGNLLTKLDARNITTTFTYDALNRPKTKTYANDGGITPAVSYLYDNETFPTGAPSPFNRGASTGRLVAVNYGGGSQGDYFGYDELGRAVRKTQQIGGLNYPITATYNYAGAMLTENYPSGRRVTMDYDNAGRLNSFSGTLGDGNLRNYATELSYAAAGQLIKEKFGTTTAMTTALYHRMYFNNRQQMYNIRLGTGEADNFGDPSNLNRGELRLYYNTDYLTNSGTNNNGNLHRAEHVIPLDDNHTNWTDGVIYYHYDALNRLTSVDELPIASWVKPPGGDPAEGWLPQSYSQKYKYDRWGNRQLNVAGTWGIGINRKDFGKNDTNNRLAVPVGQSGAMNYDDAGNLTFDNYSQTNMSHSYQYDAENRLKQATVGSTTSNYVYDGNGKRVRRPENGGERWQVYGLGGELVAEYPVSGATNSPQKEYGYRNGQLLVVYDASETGDKRWQWLVTDHLGTPRMIADLSGSLAGMKRHDYLPFGEELFAGTGVRSANTGYADDNVRQQFTGYERDNETGLDFAQARYHASIQGRFTSTDSYNIIFEKEKGRDEKERDQFFYNYISQPQNWNKYTYVLNNPLKFADPDGRRALTADDWRRFQSLYDEYNKAGTAGDTTLQNAIGNAINEIALAIDAVPEGTQDPANLKAVFFAIDRLGDTSYGKSGTVSNGVTVTVGAGDWKCNVFCANSYAQGAGVGFGGKGVPTNSTFLGGLAGRRYPPVANDYADPSKTIPNFDVVSSPGLGDIVAYPSPGGIGHAAISVGGNAVIYAGRHDVKTNTVTRTQSELGSPSITYRSFPCRVATP